MKARFEAHVDATAGHTLFPFRGGTVSIRLRRARGRDDPQFDQSGRRTLGDDIYKLDQSLADLPRSLCRQYLWCGFLSNVDPISMSACSPHTHLEGNDGNRIVLDSVITCPQCGLARTGRMPADACQIVYECPGCGIRLRPKPGDCCVFCSYGSVRCPAVQLV